MGKHLAFAIRIALVRLDLDSALRLNILRKSYSSGIVYEASARFVKVSRMRSYVSQKIRRKLIEYV